MVLSISESDISIPMCNYGDSLLISSLCRTRSEPRLRLYFRTVEKAAQSKLGQVYAAVRAGQHSGNGFARAGSNTETMATESRRDVKTRNLFRLLNDRNNVGRGLDDSRPGLNDFGIGELRKHGVEAGANSIDCQRVRLRIQHPRFLER